MKENVERRIRTTVYIIFAVSSIPFLFYGVAFLTPTFTFALWGAIAVFIVIDVIEQRLKKKNNDIEHVIED